LAVCSKICDRLRSCLNWNEKQTISLKSSPHTSVYGVPLYLFTNKTIIYSLPTLKHLKFIWAYGKQFHLHLFSLLPPFLKILSSRGQWITQHNTNYVAVFTSKFLICDDFDFHYVSCHYVII
jgi:hypothetical protein